MKTADKIQRVRKTKWKPEHWVLVSFFLILYDVMAISASSFLALLIRFDFLFSAIPAEYMTAYLGFLPLYLIFCIMLLWRLRLYRSLWRFASVSELTRLLMMTVLSTGFQLAGNTVFIRLTTTVSWYIRMPTSYYIIGSLLQFLFMTAIRFAYRFILLMRKGAYRERSGVSETGGMWNIMLIGAGNAGQMILRDVRTASEVKGRVVCVIDDNPNKWGRDMEGVPIIGGRDSILSGVRTYGVNKIYVAIPSASMQSRKEILDICKETDCEVKNLPGMYQLMQDQVKVSAMRDVSVEDLLGREPVRADLKEVFDFIHGKTVLVTGGGGSIGSELCRQIAGHAPKQLIVLDIYENSTYELQLELREKFPALNLVVIIASVRDSRKMFQVFEQYRPQVVYHAAAHKHVPLMEESPCEVIKNNAIGTYKTAYAAMVHGCERFVLISTDKAVNPTNIMGASKRLCEMIIQSFDAKIKAGKAHELPQLFTHGDLPWMDAHMEASAPEGYTPLTKEAGADIHTEFVAVRFGNVLGSNGSVIPIFKRQIEKGGPVTVTHPDIIRYFMTIPEAVSLVLLAGTYASGGEIFVLDMGSPVKIDTLARNLIKLSGYVPNVDIMIEYTRLRPGEKLYEEKLMAEEGMKTTANSQIYIGSPIPFDPDAFLASLHDLMKAAYDNRPDIRSRVKEVVTTYHPERN